MKRHKNISKKLLAAGAGVLGMLSFSLTSCVKNNYTPPPPTALMSVTQAMPDESPLNFYVNGNRVDRNPLNYGDNLDYFSVFAGDRTANFYDLSMATVLSAPITLAANNAYSLFLTNTAANPQVLFLTDTLTKPASGDASLRFINLSPDAPAVDLAVQGGAVLVSNRTFKGYSSFANIKGSTSYTFEIRKKGTTTVLATLPNVMLNTGYVYSILFEGLSASLNSTDKLSASLVTNAYFL